MKTLTLVRYFNEISTQAIVAQDADYEKILWFMKMMICNDNE